MSIIKQNYGEIDRLRGTMYLYTQQNASAIPSSTYQEATILSLYDFPTYIVKTVTIEAQFYYNNTWNYSSTYPVRMTYGGTNYNGTGRVSISSNDVADGKLSGNLACYYNTNGNNYRTRLKITIEFE